MLTSVSADIGCADRGRVETRGVTGSGLGAVRTALVQDAAAPVDAAARDARPEERVDAGPPGAALGGSCCTASEAPGCGDPAVEACVCGADPTCCTAGFDDLCVREAQSRCGQSCAPAAENDCCTVSDTGGCVGEEIAACICAIDPFCCLFRFDDNCVRLGLAECGSRCSAEESAPEGLESREPERLARGDCR